MNNYKFAITLFYTITFNCDYLLEEWLVIISAFVPQMKIQATVSNPLFIGQSSDLLNTKRGKPIVIPNLSASRRI